MLRILKGIQKSGGTHVSRELMYAIRAAGVVFVNKIDAWDLASGPPSYQLSNKAGNMA